MVMKCRNGSIIVIAVLFIMVSLGSPGWSQVVKESFEYEGGTLDAMGDVTDGWAGPWTMTAGDVLVIDGNMDPDTEGKSIETVQATGGTITYFRYLAETWQDNGEPYWVGFMFQRRDDGVLSSWGGLSLFLDDTELLFMGSPWQANRIGIDCTGFGAFPSEYTDLEPAWIVVKCDMNGLADNDSVYLWVNPDPGQEPDIANADARGAFKGSDGFNRVRIGNDAGYILAYDMIRLGTSFDQIKGGGGGGFNIVIDAQKDDWYKTLTGPDNGYILIPSTMLSLGQETPPDDDQDLSAFCWLAWDDAYFYFYAEVSDDIVLVNNATTYENDAIELKIDPDPTQATTAGVAAVRLSALGEADADIPDGVDNIVKGNELDVPFEPIEGQDYARRMTDNGYNLEFRLPWTSIVRSDKVVDVTVGSYFGLAINVMDNDSDHRETVAQWSAGMQDAVWSNPQLHGTVTFLADHKFKMEPVNSAGGDAVNPNPDAYIPPQTDVASDKSINAARTFGLMQNYPNPFNPTTNIAYSLPRRASVKLQVFDLSGRPIKTLVDEEQAPGNYTVPFDGTRLTSGVYIYRLQSGNQMITRKMMFMK
jgi:hypothetical protein